MMTEPTNPPKARQPRGFKDYRANEVKLREFLVSKITDVYRSFGFAPLETSVFEYVDSLGKFLPESDTPDGGIFSFKDDDGEWIATRYDLTAPLSRFYAQNAQTLPKPFRRYQVGPVFRQEQTGAGRFRQFYQLDFDTVGSSNIITDYETAIILKKALASLGLAEKDFTVKLNNRKVLAGLLGLLGIEEGTSKFVSVMRNMDKLDKLGLTEIRKLLGKGRQDESGVFTPGSELDDDQAEKITQFLDSRKVDRESTLQAMDKFVQGSDLGQQGIAELSQISSMLNREDTNIVIDPSLVRGLAYYTGPVYEAELNFEVPDEKGVMRKFGSIAGGGRYDDLVKRFTGQIIPACGASIGVDRLMAAMASLESFKVHASFEGPVIIARLDSTLLDEYLNIDHELRAAGINCEIYQGEGGVSAQTKYADRRGSRALVLLGSDEMAEGVVSVKDLRLGGKMSEQIGDRKTWLEKKPAQAKIPRADLISAIREIQNRD